VTARAQSPEGKVGQVHPRNEGQREGATEEQEQRHSLGSERGFAQGGHVGGPSPVRARRLLGQIRHHRIDLDGQLLQSEARAQPDHVANE